MAIDSEAKRASALYFIRHRKGRLIADGTISAPDFQDIVGFYRGILALVPGALYAVDLLSATVPQPTITASVPQPTVTTTATQPTITVTAKNDIR
jgi:hypothetical protein